MKIGCICMAAGQSERFGSNKLFEAYKGKSLIERALAVIPAQEFYRVVIVTQYPQIADLAAQAGYVLCLNTQPELGLSHTIALGMEALSDADAILFLVADQPLLKKESVCRALLLFKSHPEHIVAMSHEKRRGNPCVFPKAYFPELLALTGDHGGRSVIEQHEGALLLCEVADEKELLDIDTPEQLR